MRFRHGRILLTGKRLNLFVVNILGDQPPHHTLYLKQVQQLGNTGAKIAHFHYITVAIEDTNILS
jgi:hypothetical protein